MTSNNDGKEFVKWLKEWRSEIRSHCSLAPMRAEKRKDENESGSGKHSISGRNGIPAPTMAIKGLKSTGRFEHH
jgi:hypothetical protein